MDKTTTTLSDEPKVKTRTAVAKETKVPESKLRDIAAIEKADPDLHRQVAAGEVTIREAKTKVKSKQKKRAKCETNEDLANKAMRFMDRISPKRKNFALSLQRISNLANTIGLSDSESTKEEEAEPKGFDESEEGHRLREWLRADLNRWPEEYLNEAAHWIRQVLEKEFNLQDSTKKRPA